jgi:hypothetical protein
LKRLFIQNGFHSFKTLSDVVINDKLAKKQKGRPQGWNALRTA